MLDSMCMALEKPPLYKKSEGAFWNDEYISKVCRMDEGACSPDLLSNTS